jgi:hypothetical protein
MVKKIKKKISKGAEKTAWLLGFDSEGEAAVYVHQHGSTPPGQLHRVEADHKRCGPVVMCCERARPPFAAAVPALCERATQWRAQPAGHLKGWFEGGLETMYFVLCDANDAAVFYTFALARPQALDLLFGRTKPDMYRLPEFKMVKPDYDVEPSSTPARVIDVSPDGPTDELSSTP